MSSDDIEDLALGLELALDDDDHDVDRDDEGQHGGDARRRRRDIGRGVIISRRSARRTRRAADRDDAGRDDGGDGADQQQQHEKHEGALDGDLFFRPGTASIFCKTWGCSHNVSDGEYMAGLLSAEGYSIVLEDSLKDEADVWLLNSCTVKGPSESSFVSEVRRGLDRGKRVVVAGCVPQGTSFSGREWENLSIVGVQMVDRVVEVVEETLRGNVVRLTRERKTEDRKRRAGGAPLDLPKMRRCQYIEIIPINTGCLNQCTYCKTKHARGNLASYPLEEIWDRVRSVLVEDGGIVKEIWLTSEDTGAYGIDIGVTIVDLLWGIIRVMEESPNRDAMLRIGMTNPPYILQHLDEMVKILNHERVFSFLHVPVQSASDAVLDSMKRLYTCADFERVVDTLTAGVPGMTIATDIICGFPTETDADFEATLVLCARHRFPALHISQFYPRPGTPAARMPMLPQHVIKSRSRRLTELFNSYEHHSGSMGARLRVLVTTLSTDGRFWVAHDKGYRQVLVPLVDGLLGTWVDVEVVRTGKFFLEGRLLSSPIDASVGGGGEGLVNVGGGRLERRGIPLRKRSLPGAATLENTGLVVGAATAASAAVLAVSLRRLAKGESDATVFGAIVATAAVTCAGIYFMMMGTKKK